jgi:hypothetical protein
MRRRIFATLAAMLLAADISAQQPPTAATIRFRGGGSSTDTIVVRCSDVRVQIALQPGTSLEPMRAEDFAAVLQRVIDQRLLLHSVGSEGYLFDWNPTDQEVRNSLTAVGSYFPTTKDLEKRLVWAGFDSLNDDELQRTMRTRWLIEKYIDVHFRLPANAGPELVEKYYEELFRPEFQKSRPDLIVPALNDKRAEITSIITEMRTEAALQQFLARKRRMMSIEITSEQCSKELDTPRIESCPL